MMRSSMFARIISLIFAVNVTCSACASSGGDQWSDLDYSNVYRAAGEGRDIDSTYRQPTVVGCVNDDLYLCK